MYSPIQGSCERKQGICDLRSWRCACTTFSEKIVSNMGSALERIVNLIPKDTVLHIPTMLAGKVDTDMDMIMK